MVDEVLLHPSQSFSSSIHHHQIILNLIIVSKHNVLLSTVTPAKSRANINA